MTPDESMAYRELCKSYHAIDDFRAKLLGFLPLATGAGILFTAKESSALLEHLSAPIGIFGFLITLGLFCYELYGIAKCSELIRTGRKLERALNIHGQFVSRPDGILGLINEPFAAGVIYPAVLASWSLLAFLHSKDGKLQNPDTYAWLTAGSVFVAGLAITLVYDYCLKTRRRDPELCDRCGKALACDKSARARITPLQTCPDYVLCAGCSEALKTWLKDMHPA